MNTIKYKDLRTWFLDNEDAKANAKEYFGDNQPSIHETGFYSAPSWNWGYRIGIVGVTVDIGDSEGVEYDSTETKWFEVVTQFGQVKAARAIYMPIVGGQTK